MEAIKRMGFGSSVTEGFIGLSAVALAIIGLAHISPWVLASIATIALGAAFEFETGAVAARFSALEHQAQSLPSNRSWERWGGITVGFLTGCAGIALGILALLGIHPVVLIPVAVIAYGAALIMDSGVRLLLNGMEGKHPVFSGIGYGAAASSAFEALVGLGGITLGILSIIGLSPQSLSLVALLSVGAAMLVVGSFVGGRLRFLYRS